MLPSILCRKENRDLGREERENKSRGKKENRKAKEYLFVKRSGFADQRLVSDSSMFSAIVLVARFTAL